MLTDFHETSVAGLLFVTHMKIQGFHMVLAI